MERRTGRDRRKDKRYRVTMDIEWADAWGRKPGTLSDISTLGCFVLCSGAVEDGAVVTLYLPISGGMKAEFSGVVANHLVEVGFAARFIELTPAQTEFLDNFIAVHAER